MWARLSKLNISKTKIRDPEEDPDSSEQHANVTSSASEAHSNYSMHLTAQNSSNRSSVFPAPPDPPSSPSKSGLKNIFRRSKVIVMKSNDDSRSGDNVLHSSGSEEKRRSFLGISRDENVLHIPQSESQSDKAEIQQSTLYLVSRTPTGSVRSILRTPNTPKNNQNVRFFSRDLYRIITPDTSADGPLPLVIEPPPPNEKEALPERTLPDATNMPPSYPFPSSLPVEQDIFSPPRNTSSPVPQRDTSNSISSLSLPNFPGDLSNIFDMSHELEAIPRDESLFDLPVVVANKIPDLEGADEMVATAVPANSTVIKMEEEPKMSKNSHSTSDTTVFYTPQRSLLPQDLTLSPKDVSVPSKSLLPNETVYHTPDTTALRSPSTPANASQAVNATVYHTPTDLSRPFPSMSSPCSESFVSLEARVELQQSLGLQYDADLSARDEMVQVLQFKAEAAERTAEAWKAEGERKERKVERMRKRCKEWEAQCNWLTDQLDRSREESADRSMLDEASGEALRMLHGSIKNLEAAKASLETQIRDGEVRLRMETEARIAAQNMADKLRAEVEEKKKEVMDMRDREIRGSDGVETLERELQTWKEKAEKLEKDVGAELEHFKKTLEMSQSTEDGMDQLKQEVIRREQEYADLRESHRSAEFAWVEERAAIIQAREDAERKCTYLEKENERLHHAEDELNLLKPELEAQWSRTERATEELEDLKMVWETKEAEWSERMDSLLEEKEELEVAREEFESVLQSRQSVEAERDEILEELQVERENHDRLHEELVELEHHFTQLQNEHEFSVGNEARLDQLLRLRDKEVTELNERLGSAQEEAEEMHTQVGKTQRDQSRLVDEQARTLSEVESREKQCRSELESLIQKKAEEEVAMEGLRESVGSLREEVEKLRRQVHELQHESADKEVKIVQLLKSKAQDKEDKEGLNIALDSKQQELELLKRKLGVRGTAGSTPAPPSRIHRMSDFNLRAAGTPGPNSTIGTDVQDSVLPKGRDRRPSSSMDTPAPATLRPSLRTNVSADSNAIAPSVVKQARFDTGKPLPSIRPSSRTSIATPTPTPLQRKPSTALSTSRLSSSSTNKPIVPSGHAHRRSSSSIDSTGVKVIGRINHSAGPSLDESVEGEYEPEIMEKENKALPLRKSTAPSIPRRKTLVPAS